MPKNNVPAPKSAMGKNWIFVINNYTDKDEKWCNEVICSYIVVSKEVGEKGTPHLQGFIQFDKNCRLSALKKLHATAHWEIAKADSERNVNYVKKVDSELLTERGQRRSATLRALKARDRWEAAVTSAKAGNFEDIEADMRVRYYNTWKRIYEDAPRSLETIDGDLDNLWIYGPTGTGKSKMAREKFPEAYIKNLNKWWCGYNHEETVIIEEYHPDSKLNHFIKIWADRYPFRGEYKGGSAMFRPKRIVVCSNYTIEECFTGVDLEPIKRRFKIVNLT